MKSELRKFYQDLPLFSFCRVRMIYFRIFCSPGGHFLSLSVRSGTRTEGAKAPDIQRRKEKEIETKEE